MAEWQPIAVQRATRGSPPNHSVFPMIPRGENTDTTPAGPGPSTAPFFVLNMNLPGNFDGASTNTRARHANTARPLLSALTRPLLFFFLAESNMLRWGGSRIQLHFTTRVVALEPPLKKRPKLGVPQTRRAFRSDQESANCRRVSQWRKRRRKAMLALPQPLLPRRKRPRHQSQ